MNRFVMFIAMLSISMLLIVACGGSGGGDNPQPTPAPIPTVVTWDQAKAVIIGNCQKCHDGVKEPLLAPEAVFRASAAKAELAANTMPPAPNVISSADKQVLVSFLNQ